MQALHMGLLDDLLTSKTDPVSAANADVLVSYETRIKNINALEDTIEDLSDDELRQATHQAIMPACLISHIVLSLSLCLSPPFSFIFASGARSSVKVVMVKKKKKT